MSGGQIIHHNWTIWVSNERLGLFALSFGGPNIAQICAGYLQVKIPKKIVAVIMQPWLFLEFNPWIPPKMRQTVLWQLKKLSKIYSKACLLICFYIKMFPTPTFVKQDFFRNCQFLTHLLLIFLNILTILWTFYIVASARSLQIWNLQYLSFHLTPWLSSLKKLT